MNEIAKQLRTLADDIDDGRIGVTSVERDERVYEWRATRPSEQEITLTLELLVTDEADANFAREYR